MFLTSVRRISGLVPERFYITIVLKTDSESGHVDASIEVEFIGTQAMTLTLQELEKLEISRATEALGSSLRTPVPDAA